MATRGDFYVGRGPHAEWLGSIAFDAYPSDSDLQAVIAADSESAYRAAVGALAVRDDFTRPEQGWPWPWNDSSTTDVAYAFDEGRVWFCWSRWLDARVWGHRDPDEVSAAEHGLPEPVFPNMSRRRRLALGTPRDSAMLITRRPDR